MTTALPTKAELETAAAIVYAAMAPTPQYCWPLLNEALGTEVWVKHENHTPTGAFKVRGGLVYIHELAQRAPEVRGVVSATRGNHGQSIGFAVRRHGLQATIVVPHCNSREHAARLAASQGLHMIPSMHKDLVRGVATYWVELFTAQPGLDVVFVPIGQGSGICAAVAARNALGLKTRIIGVVSAHALSYKLSFEQKRKVISDVTTVIADGVACRVPDDGALDIILNHVDQVVAVSDAQVAQAMKLYFVTTHNVAEGAGAVPLAAALQMKDALKGLKVGLPLCGGNVDHDQLAEILASTASVVPAGADYALAA